MDCLRDIFIFWPEELDRHVLKNRSKFFQGIRKALFRMSERKDLQKIENIINPHTVGIWNFS